MLLIEQWGTGLQRIIKECAAWGADKPLFEEFHDEFKVTLYSSIPLSDQAAALWKITERAARLRLIKLIDAGVIKKTGTSVNDPHGAYILTE